MRVALVKKQNLGGARLSYLTARLFASEHELDISQRPVWHLESYTPNLYAVVLKDSGLPIGIIYAAGPKTAIDASWWIDSKYRGQGYAAEAIDTLADYLKENGATGIGNILIAAYGENHAASSKLVKRLKGLFK